MRLESNVPGCVDRALPPNPGVFSSSGLVSPKLMLISCMSHTQGVTGSAMAGIDAYSAIAELLHKTQVRNMHTIAPGRCLFFPSSKQQREARVCAWSRVSPLPPMTPGLHHGPPAPVLYDASVSCAAERHAWVGEVCWVWHLAHAAVTSQPPEHDFPKMPSCREVLRLALSMPSSRNPSPCSHRLRSSSRSSSCTWTGVGGICCGRRFLQR